jgi:hypothetical protein
MPKITDADVLADIADPGVIAEIASDALGRRERLDQEARTEGSQHGAVFGLRVEIDDGFEAARTRHILDDDRGRTGQVPGQMALHQPRIGVGAAPGRQADDDL